MLNRIMLFLIIIMFIVPFANAQTEGFTSESDAEVLRLIRNEKLDLILPGAMRDNNVEMWIHVTRPGDPDPIAQQFGKTFGYLIFTDLGDRIERAVFGNAGAVEKIDIQGSHSVAQAFSGYNYNNLDPRQDFTIPDVYDEIREFVAELDPKTIAVNFSDWFPVADGISHTQYLKLEIILGPKYSTRIISAENVINDFVVRRTSREVSAQVHTLAMARQIALETLSTIVPGMTTSKDIRKDNLLGGVRIYYSAQSKRTAPPDHRWWIYDPEYVLQRGDFFAYSVGYSYMGFGVDTQIHIYILREGETSVPESIQYAWDQGKKAQGIIRPHVKVGMTGGESLDSMVKAMEEAGYKYIELPDIGIEDYKIIQRALADTDKSGFYIDLHSIGNNPSDLNEAGPSMAAFRQDTYHLKIQENHIFAFEYVVNTNLPERPGFPIAINFSNIQVVTNRGVEWIQPPNEGIVLIH